MIRHERRRMMLLFSLALALASAGAWYRWSATTNPAFNLFYFIAGIAFGVASVVVLVKSLRQ